MKIGYIETFPLIGHDRWQKIPLEVEVPYEIDLLNATDEEIEKFMLKVRRVQYALKKQVQSFFFESNKAAEKQVKEEKVIQIGITPEDIYSCTDLKTLEQSYKFLVKNKPALQEAYDQQHQKLSQ